MVAVSDSTGTAVGASDSPTMAQAPPRVSRALSGPGGRSQARRIALTVVAFAGSGGTTVAFNLVLVRAVGRGEYGSISRAYALAMALAQLVMAGAVPALARVVGSSGQGEGRAGRAHAALRIVLIMAASLVPVYVALSIAGLSSTQPQYLIWGALLVIIYATYFAGKVFLFVLNDVQKYAWLEISSDIVFVLALGALAAFDPRDSLAVFSIAYGWFLYRLHRYLADRRGELHIKRKDVRFALLALLASYSTSARFPLVIAAAGAATSSFAAAKIAAILNIAIPLQLLPQAVSMLAFADIARDGVDASKSVKTMAIGVAALSGWVVACGMALSGSATEIALGGRYVGSGPSFAVLLAGMSIYIAMMPVGNALAGAGHAGINAISGGAGLVVAVVGTVLVASSGSTAVAIVVAASFAVTSGTLVLPARRWLGFGFEPLLAGVAMPATAGIALLILGPTVIIGVGIPLVGLAVTALLVRAGLPGGSGFGLRSRARETLA
jgi:O-antigen/teichoic acid export membrane protein